MWKCFKKMQLIVAYSSWCPVVCQSNLEQLLLVLVPPTLVPIKEADYEIHEESSPIKNTISWRMARWTSKISDFMKSEESSCCAMLATNKHGNNMTSHYFKKISVSCRVQCFKYFFEGSQNCNCTVCLGLTIRERWIRSGEGGEQIS